MTDNPLRPITSEIDFNRVSREREFKTNAVALQAREAGWDTNRTADALAAADLPYEKLLTNPATPNVTFYALKNYVANPDHHVEFITAQNNPELTATVARETARLNGISGQEYRPPRVMIVDGLARESNGSPLKYSSNLDAVLIDRDFAENISDKEALSGLVGHELTHRYQNSDTQAMTRLRAQYGNTSPDVLRGVRDLETQADIGGSVLTSPAVMERGLTSVMGTAINSPDNLAAENYRQQTPGINFNTALSRYATMPENERQARRDAVAILPPERQVALSRDLERDYRSTETELEPIQSHASFDHRIQMMELMKSDPSLADSLRSLRGVESTTLTNATGGGPPPVPNVATPPRGQEAPQR